MGRRRRSPAEDERIEALRPGFSYVELERVDPAQNEKRFYRLSWQPTLLDGGAVVRIYGRKGGHRRVMAPVPFASFGDAWPLIRATLRLRLRHGYRITVLDRDPAA